MKLKISEFSYKRLKDFRLNVFRKFIFENLSGYLVLNLERSIKIGNISPMERHDIKISINRISKKLPYCPENILLQDHQKLKTSSTKPKFLP